METVKEDDSPAEEEGNYAMPVTSNLLNMGASPQESENQAVREELMKLVDIVEESFEDVVERKEKGQSSRQGTHKHVHVVIQIPGNKERNQRLDNREQSLAEASSCAAEKEIHYWDKAFLRRGRDSISNCFKVLDGCQRGARECNE